MDFMNILAIDSAMNGCGAGVCAGGTVHARAEAMASGQGERLVPMVQDVMRGAGLSYTDLQAIVTTVGPGAFTGLRIGLSAARALGLATNVPVFGVTTLQALASQYARDKKPAGKIAVILETKRMDFYFQVFTADAEVLSEAAAMDAAGVLKLIPADAVVIGDALERFKAEAGNPKLHFASGYELPDMGVAAALFYENEGRGAYTQPAEPVYLRGADVTVPKKPARPAVASQL